MSEATGTRRCPRRAAAPRETHHSTVRVAARAATRQLPRLRSCIVSSLFRRRSQAVDDSAEESATPDDATPKAESSADDPEDAAARRPKAGVKAHTSGKGRPTPKRRDAQRRRNAEPPPANRKEAYKRLRERQRTERAEVRQAMMRGDDKHLPRRDKGPVRALVRDIVDSRRNVGTWFFIGALIILLGTSPSMPPLVQLGSQGVWLALLLAFIFDSFLITRRVRQLVAERHPKSEEALWRLAGYAIMRSITFRKLRMPAARVKPGTAI